MVDVIIAKTKAKKTEYLLNVTLVGCSYGLWLLYLATITFTNIICKNKRNLCDLFDTKKPALCALKLTIHLVFFTIPVPYYNEFFVIAKISAL